MVLARKSHVKGTAGQFRLSSYCTASIRPLAGSFCLPTRWVIFTQSGAGPQKRRGKNPIGEFLKSARGKIVVRTMVSMRPIQGVAVLVLCGASLGGTRAAVIDSDWVGGTSNWNSAANWSPAGVPNNNVTDTYNVRIDNGSPTASVVSLDTTVTIDDLLIDADDELIIGNSRSLTVNGTATNDGTARLDSSGATTNFLLEGNLLTGAGELIISDRLTNRFRGSSGGTLTHGANHTIRGAGTFGVNVSGMINQGTIIADGTNPIVIDPSVSTSFTNRHAKSHRHRRHSAGARCRSHQHRVHDRN